MKTLSTEYIDSLSKSSRFEAVAKFLTDFYKEAVGEEWDNLPVAGLDPRSIVVDPITWRKFLSYFASKFPALNEGDGDAAAWLLFDKGPAVGKLSYREQTVSNVSEGVTLDSLRAISEEFKVNYEKEEGAGQFDYWNRLHQLQESYVNLWLKQVSTWDELEEIMEALSEFDLHLKSRRSYKTIFSITPIDDNRVGYLFDDARSRGQSMIKNLWRWFEIRA